LTLISQGAAINADITGAPTREHPLGHTVRHTSSVTKTTTKFSLSLPSELLAATDQHLVRPGETRSATIARVLREALRAAEDAELDAEYARVFPNGPSEADQARARALSRAAFRSVHGPRD